jgi:hypothetical protein
MHSTNAPLRRPTTASMDWAALHSLISVNVVSGGDSTASTSTRHTRCGASPRKRPFLAIECIGCSEVLWLTGTLCLAFAQGNFGVGNLAFFRSDAYANFTAHLLRQPGLYSHRWVDQSIWPIALAALAPGRVEQWPSLAPSLRHESRSLGKRFFVTGRKTWRGPEDGYTYQPPGVSHGTCPTLHASNAARFAEFEAV